MNPNFQDFISKFRLDDFAIYESKYWKWSLRPVHSTIGAGILSLRRYDERMSNITSDESKDLVVIIKVIEDTLKKVFNYDKINYMMLMMVDTHIHFHVIPRYSREISFEDLTWKDGGWPALPALGAGDEYEYSVLNSIKDTLIDNLVV